MYDQSKPYRRPGDNANRSTTLSLLKKQGRPQSYVQVTLSSDSGRDSESGADLFHISSPALTLLPLAFSLDDHDHLCFFWQTHNTTPHHVRNKSHTSVYHVGIHLGGTDAYAGQTPRSQRSKPRSPRCKTRPCPPPHLLLGPPRGLRVRVRARGREWSRIIRRKEGKGGRAC